MKIEICANSMRSAENAKAGGADRIELCRRLEIGGTTPTEEEIRYCVKQLGLRTHVLVRPRGGDFCYSEAEFGQILEEIDMCRRCGTHAVVVGFLTAEGMIDEERTREAVRRAEGMEVTFHRAFDEMQQEPSEALETLVRCGCHRLLTSGCHLSAEAGVGVIKALVRQSQGRITILAGAGVTPKNAALIARETGVTEMHGSCKHTLADGTTETDVETVRELLRAVGE